MKPIFVILFEFVPLEITPPIKEKVHHAQEQEASIYRWLVADSGDADNTTPDLGRPGRWHANVVSGPNELKGIPFSYPFVCWGHFADKIQFENDCNEESVVFSLLSFLEGNGVSDGFDIELYEVRDGEKHYFETIVDGHYPD